MPKSRHQKKVDRRRSLEAQYNHPTKKRAGTIAYSPINKRNKSALRMKRALIKALELRKSMQETLEQRKKG